MKTIHVNWFLNRYELIDFLRDYNIRTSYERLSDLMKDGLFPQPRLRIIGAPKVRMCKLWDQATVKDWVDCFHSVWEIPDAKGALIRTSQAKAIRHEHDSLFEHEPKRVHFASLPWRAAEILNVDTPFQVSIVDVVEPEPEAKLEPQEEAQKPSENAIPFDNPEGDQSPSTIYVSPVLIDQLKQLMDRIEIHYGALKMEFERVLQKATKIELKVNALAWSLKHPQQKDELTVDKVLEDLEKNP